MSDTKPPIVLLPRWRHDELRATAIVDAMQRSREAGKPIPQEWIDELTELLMTRIDRLPYDEVSE